MEEWTLLLCGVPAKLFNQSELAEKRDHFLRRWLCARAGEVLPNCLYGRVRAGYGRRHSGFYFPVHFFRRNTAVVRYLF